MLEGTYGEQLMNGGISDMATKAQVWLSSPMGTSSDITWAMFLAGCVVIYIVWRVTTDG